MTPTPDPEPVSPRLDLLIDGIEVVVSLMEFPGPLSERDCHEYARRLRARIAEFKEAR